jgi:hypothetical protein
MLLALWSAPRCRSTAFERTMIERGDFTVLHEPFSHVADFGSATVGGYTVHSERELIATLAALPGRVFFKDTTDFHYPELVADRDFLRRARHAFLIRDPAEAIASHQRLNPQLSLDEVGFARLYEIFEAVSRATGEPPLVIDSADLVAHPYEVVSAYCAHVGIDFLQDALTWRPGLVPQWQRTARWHVDAGQSRGLGVGAPAAAPPSFVDQPDLAELYRFHLPYYRKLHARRLVVGTSRLLRSVPIPPPSKKDPPS